MASLANSALLLILLTFSAAPCSLASSLHLHTYVSLTGEKQNSEWFSNCQVGYRKMGVKNCENAGGSTKMNKAAWTQNLRAALPPPPAPFKKIPSRSGGSPPPT